VKIPIELASAASNPSSRTASACPSLVAAATRSAIASVASSGRADSMRWTVSSVILADSNEHQAFEHKRKNRLAPDVHKDRPRLHARRMARGVRPPHAPLQAANQE
jgi:hypothetical protein